MDRENQSKEIRPISAWALFNSIAQVKESQQLDFNGILHKHEKSPPEGRDFFRVSY